MTELFRSHLAHSPAWLVLPALLLTALAGCGRPAGDKSAEAEKLMEASRAWSRASAARNAEDMLEYWDEDAVIFEPGAPPLRGKEAIRASVVQGTKIPGFSTSWEPLEAKISDSGDMGYLIERVQVSMTDATGNVSSRERRGVTIWRKQPDGPWRNVVDISNEGPDK